MCISDGASSGLSRGIQGGMTRKPAVAEKDICLHVARQLEPGKLCYADRLQVHNVCSLHGNRHMEIHRLTCH